MLEDKHIERIMEIFDSKSDVEYVAVSIDNTKIAENEYNLSVSSYVQAKDNRETVDIATLNHSTVWCCVDNKPSNFYPHKDSPLLRPQQA